MARVPYLEPADLADDDKDLLKRPIWLAKALVNSPKAARAFFGLGGYIRHGSKLDPRLRELAILQVGWLAKSPYEWSHHVKLGHDFGVSYEDVQALIDDTDGKPTTLDAITRLVLQAAREITTGGEMAADTFAALRTVPSSATSSASHDGTRPAACRGRPLSVAYRLLPKSVIHYDRG